MSDFSAQLSGEARYLRKLSENSASSKARAEYLTWLWRQEVGFRADFIAQLHTAFESMSGADLPDVEGAYYKTTEGGGSSLIGLLGYFQSTTGGDPTPDKSIRKLACLPVTPDGGVVHLGIAEPDLRSRNFSAFTCPWYDWDL